MAEDSYAPKSPDLSSFSAAPTQPSPPPQPPLPGPAQQQFPQHQQQHEIPWNHHQQPAFPPQQQLGGPQTPSHHRHSSVGTDYRYVPPHAHTQAPSTQYPPPSQQLPPTNIKAEPHYASTTPAIKNEYPPNNQPYPPAQFQIQQHHHAHIAPHPPPPAPYGNQPQVAQQPGQAYPNDPRFIPPTYAFKHQPPAHLPSEQQHQLPLKSEPSDMPPRKAAQPAPAPPAIDPSPVRTKFPTARIKRIMQADEEVGKVAQQTPIAVGKALELFMIHVVTKSADIAREKNSKRVTAQMLKQVIETDGQYDFLADIAAKVGDEEKKGGRSASGAKVETDSSDEEMEVEPKKKGRGGGGGGGGRKKKAAA